MALTTNFLDQLYQMRVVRRFEQTRIGKNVISQLALRANGDPMQQLDDERYPRAREIREILRRLTQPLSSLETEWVEKIENERRRYHDCHDLLVDGELGETYDSGTERVSDVVKASKPPKQALMLYLLARVTNPLSTIELGTNLGISSSYIGAALSDNQQNGKLVTIDQSPYRHRQAQQLHSRLGLENISYATGRFSEALDDVLNRIAPIDLAFIDGHHQYQPTRDYFEKICKFASPAAVFVFDDIRWSDGMFKVWSELRADKRFGLVADFRSFGICVSNQEPSEDRLVLPTIYAF